MKVLGVIVELSPGMRRLDSNLSDPAALISIDGPTSVLHWARVAFQANGIQNILYVGSYHIEKILAQFPDISVRYEPEWEGARFLRAINSLPAQDFDAFLFARSDVVLTKDAIRTLLDSSSHHAAGHIDANEHIGAILVPSQNLPSIVANKEGNFGANGLGLLAHGASSIDISLRAASIDDPERLASVLFPGKARALAQIGSVIQSLEVVDQFHFSLDEWRMRPADIVNSIKSRFPDALVIVRSSASAEDAFGSSHAGYFKSISNIRPCNEGALIAAIKEVAQSFTRDGRTVDDRDEIFVQPQVTEIESSGVMFTRDLTSRAPYFVVSLEHGTGRSDTVTAGLAGDVETHYVAWTADDRLLPAHVATSVRAGRELISLTSHDAIDVELAFRLGGHGYLFQARPLSSNTKKICADSDLLDALNEARHFTQSRMGRSPGLCGSTTLFSNMADWNPAEMLGPAPRPLALSIYQNVIGNAVWAEARTALGYRDASPNPLVMSIAGRPYIDVRASLNSFLPHSLSASTAGKWIDASISLLRANPALHDKIEFEILPTAFANDWDRFVPRMKDAGLTETEIEDYRKALVDLSANIIGESQVSIDSMLSRLNTLRQRRAEILSSTERDSADRILRLLSDCKTFGTLPFAMLARCAFIAMAIMRSFEYSTPDTARSPVFPHIPTILDEILRDIRATREGGMSREEFVERHGHLRPDSYEITAPNYAEAIDAILGGENVTEPASWTQGKAGTPNGFEKFRGEFDRYCRSLGCGIDPASLQQFIERSIAGRELAKFEFMKSIDAIHTEITAFGRSVGLDRDDLSYLTIDDILQYATNSRSGATASRLKRLVGYRRKRAAITAAVRLPDLIGNTDQILAFRQEHSTPNFVTQGRVRGETAYLTAGSISSALAGKIVLIGSADPGYDWIFSRGIGGLITQYGGVGSHMAVRAAELGLPAAIGVGPTRFAAMKASRHIDLDCAKQSMTWR